MIPRAPVRGRGGAGAHTRLRPRRGRRELSGHHQRQGRREAAAWIRALAADRGGAVTAEFAIVLPAVVAVLGLMIGGISIGAQRVTLSSLAGEVVRLEARGDDGAAEQLLRERPGEVRVERRHDGPLLCATLSESPGRGILGAIRISATACAAEAKHRAAAG